MTRILLIALLCMMQLASWAQTRRPIDNKHPLWMIHVDVWNQADPQKIIDLIPDDIKPFVCMNLSFSCSYKTDLDVYEKPQNAVRTYKSWASICQKNNMWFTCQHASGGHTHIMDNDLETFEYFFKKYPNFLGWNYAEQFWGFNEAGDRSSSSEVDRLALFAKLIPMSHKYGGFLTVSFCGNIWSHGLNPTGMMKRDKNLMEACQKYPDAILWLYKYTTSSCFYNNESVSFGPFVAGLSNYYGVRYDNCGWNGALDAILGEGHGKKYPVAAGLGTVMEQTCQNGGAVWDGPELIWTEDFQNLSNTSDASGYTQRNWGHFPGFDNVWIDMFRKIIDGTMYIPTREEVVGETKFIIINDVNSGSYEDMYATWGDLYDNLYKLKDPFNRGNGQWMDNFAYMKGSGRYKTIPMAPLLNDDLARTIPNQVKKSQRNLVFSSLSSKQTKFMAAYPKVSDGDLFVSRFKNQLVTYNPNSYLNGVKSLKANVPLKYNTCESLDLVYGRLSSGIIREYKDHIICYLNNYRTDSTANRTDQIIVNGADDQPTYTVTKRGDNTAIKTTESHTTTWDAATKKWTLMISHNGPVDVRINCSGSQTRDEELLAAMIPEPTNLEAPKQPAPIDSTVVYEAENMNYKSIKNCVTEYFTYNAGAYRSTRGHTGTGFIATGTNTAGAFKISHNAKVAGDYKVVVRYSNPNSTDGKLTLTRSRVTKSITLPKTKTNEWKKATVTLSIVAGSNLLTFTNSGGLDMLIDQVTVIPPTVAEEKYGVSIRPTDTGGSAEADVTEAEEGKTVTLTVTPNEGFSLAGWNIIHGARENCLTGIDETETPNVYTFVMPDDNVTLEPIFVDNTKVYAIDFNQVLGGTFPPGWRCELIDWNGNASVQEYPNNYSGGPRSFSGFTGTYTKGIYWRGDLSYGKQADFPLTLAPGKYKLTYAVAAWKESPTYKVTVKNLSGSTVATGTSYTATPNASGNNAANLSSAVTRTLSFEITTAGNYYLNFNGSGEQILLSCLLKSVPDPTAVENVVIAPESNGNYEIFDEVGRRIPHLQRGMNIIRENGKTIKKVFVR